MLKAKAKLAIKWFPELWLAEQRIEDLAIEEAERVFRLYGFSRIQTPLVERNAILTAKSWWATAWQIYGLYWQKQWLDNLGNAKDIKDFWLRFDLTTWLARYVIDREQEIEFPLKVFNIGSVFRWERAQKGRFNQFYQCDVDVVERTVNHKHDNDVILILYKALSKIFNTLTIEKTITVHVNNRKIFEHIFNILDIEDRLIRREILWVVDSYYKIWPDAFKNKLEDLVWEKSQKFIELLNIDRKNNKIPELRESIMEINNLIENLESQWVKIIYNPYIVRWLDYYSWMVFESFIDWNENFGSICSGWRYDQLVSGIRNTTSKKWTEYTGVWWSIGLSRLLRRLYDEELITKKIPLSHVMIFNFKDELEKERREIAEILRWSWFNVDEYSWSGDLKKQFSYAENKKIPVWIFYSKNEKEKWEISIKRLHGWSTSYIVNLSSLVNELSNILI